MRCHQEDCDVCNKFLGTPGLMQVRNAYLCGLSSSIVCMIFDLDPKTFRNHAWNVGWSRRGRGFSEVILTKDTLALMAMKRYERTMPFASGNSADRALEALIKLGGFGDKVQVEKRVSVSWEQMVQGSRRRPFRDIDDDEVIEVTPVILGDHDDAAERPTTH
jgi:hypothetical protein